MSATTHKRLLAKLADAYLLLDHAPKETPTNLKGHLEFAIQRYTDFPKTGYGGRIQVASYHDDTYIIQLTTAVFYPNAQEVYEQVGYELPRQFAELLNYGDYCVETPLRRVGTTAVEWNISQQLQALATHHIKHYCANQSYAPSA